MEDLLTIDVSVFLRLRPNPPKLMTGDKIDEVLNLDCFNENSKTFLSHTFKSKNTFHTKTNHNNNNHNNNQAIRPQVVKTLSYHDKLMREVTGNINKINASNLGNIIKRIDRVVDVNNVKMISEIILAKSIIHTSYMNELVKLLKTLEARHKIEVSTAIVTNASNFMENMDTDLAQLVELDYNNYDQYCKFVLCKKTMINQVVLVSKFIMSRDIDVVPYELFDTLFTKFAKYRANVHLQVALLEMMTVFFTTFKNEKSCKSRLHDEIAINDELTTKARFIVQDIFQL